MPTPVTAEGEGEGGGTGLHNPIARNRQRDPLNESGRATHPAGCRTPSTSTMNCIYSTVNYNYYYDYDNYELLL